MQARSPSPLPGFPRLTSYAPPAAPSPAATAAPPQAPADGPAAARSAKRPREEVAGSASSSSSSPLAQRRQPMTQALAQTPAPASFHTSHRSSRAFNMPLAGGAFARRSRSDGKAGAQSAPLAVPRRPPLLAIPPSERTEQDYRAFFESGGTLARIREGDRNLLCYQAAITYEPRSLKDIPLKLKLQHPWLCQEAARLDGYTFESIPKKLLAKTSRYRESLCVLAYASPRPPRLRDVPVDLQTEARCIRSLQWAPYDLGDIPEQQITAPMCLASLKHTPQICKPKDHDAIPYRVRDAAVATAMIAHDYMMQNSSRPAPQWYPPDVITPEFVQAYIRRCPDEIYRKEMFGFPISLDLLAEALHKDPRLLVGIGSTEKAAQLLMDSAGAEGFKAGEKLPSSRWPEGVLPPDLSRLALMRWAVRTLGVSEFSKVPDDLRDDDEICRQIISKGEENSSWQSEAPEFLLRYSDAIVERLAEYPAILAELPDAVLQRLPKKSLHRASLACLAQPVNVYPYSKFRLALLKLASLPTEVLTEEIRQQIGVWLRPAALPTTAQPTRLEDLQSDDRTLERCERAIDERGSNYQHVPTKHRSWPLLSRALRTDPFLMVSDEFRDEWVPGGVTEALCLEAIAKLGVSPEGIPEAIRSRASFQAAVRALPTLAYDEEAFAESIVHGFDGPDPDALTMDWMDRLIQENPERACSVARFVKLEWALTAYRQGMDWEEAWVNISDPQIQKDFLAEIGPFTDSMTGPVHPIRPAAGASSSSSSSAAAASATRPS